VWQVGVSGGVSIFQIFKNLKNHKNLKQKKVRGCVSGFVRWVCQGVCQFFQFSKFSKFSQISKISKKNNFKPQQTHPN
jgi:hypothetical protein